VNEAVLGKREDEETGGKEPSEVHGTEETVLGNGNSSVLVTLAVVNRVSPAGGTTESQRTVSQPSRARFEGRKQKAHPNPRKHPMMRAM
jgi:hypothetical protein